MVNIDPKTEDQVSSIVAGIFTAAGVIVVIGPAVSTGINTVLPSLPPEYTGTVTTIGLAISAATGIALAIWNLRTPTKRADAAYEAGVDDGIQRQAEIVDSDTNTDQAEDEAYN